MTKPTLTDEECDAVWREAQGGEDEIFAGWKAPDHVLRFARAAFAKGVAAGRSAQRKEIATHLRAWATKHPNVGLDDDGLERIAAAIEAGSGGSDED